MSTQAASSNFHLSFESEEDRLLIAVDVAQDQRYAMALTRRLTKLMLGALADLSARGRAATLANPAIRDTVLNFEHTQAVAQSLASGDTRPSAPRKPFIAPPRLVREIKLTPKGDGGILMALDDKARVLTIDLSPQRAHSLMAGVLDMAGNAGWDLPLIAAWLERTDDAGGAEAPRIVH